MDISCSSKLRQTLICVMVKLSTKIFGHNFGTSFCNTLSLLGAALIWPNWSTWLFLYYYFFAPENDSLYLSSQFVKALLLWAWSSHTVVSPFPDIRAVLVPAGFASSGVPCRCLPLMGCGSVSSSLRPHSCLHKKHIPLVPVVTQSLGQWAARQDVGRVRKRKTTRKPQPKGYVELMSFPEGKRIS